MSDPIMMTSAPAPSRALYQELRLALVFNGGVSLAVWMGGAAKEIDRFRRAFSTATADPDTIAPYRELMDALRTVVVTDVIAGASAGGINGAFLGYVIANGKSLECAGTNTVRDLWQNLGSMDNLLAVKGDAKSVLKTDAVLFAGCANVFSQFKNAKPDLSEDSSRWVRLAITATDTHGYQVAAPVTASMDTEVSGVDHRLLFRFRRVVAPGEDKLLLGDELLAAIRAAVPDAQPAGWPFPKHRSRRDLADSENANAAALLTRAARTTSSFPIAFYSSELPLNYTAQATVKDKPGAELTATPPIGEVVRAPNAATALLPKDAPAEDAPASEQFARYAVDGGVWDNSPFEAVMRAVEKTPSGRDVRRVLTYLVGTREPAKEAPEAEEQPGLIKAVVKALATPSDLAFANDLARIRADCEQQHSRRNAVLRLLTSNADLFVLAGQLLPVYTEKLQTRAKDPASAVEVETKLVAPTLIALASLPAENGDLDAWLATPETWAWGAEPVRDTVQRARRLLRGLLRAARAANLPVEDAEALITAREHLSQLAWVIDDVTEHADPETDCAPLRRVLGEAMADFARVVTGIQQITEKLLKAADSSALDEIMAAALRATKTVTEGETDAVIKRALVLHIVLDALAGDAPQDVVDYAFTAIRPSVHWPDPAPADQHERPPLAGATFGHFGGFLRASWRLHDWMWGRIDGNQGLVNNLLTREQLTRLAPNADARTRLAGRLAAVVIPNSDDAAMLAAAALSPGAGGAGQTFQRDAALAVLSAVYADAIAAITAEDTDEAALAKLRADVARRFRYTIVRDEAPAVRDASEKDGGTPPPTDELLANPAAALFALASNRLADMPDTGELAEDAEHALANMLSAYDHGTASAIMRDAAIATDLGEKADHAARAVKHYVGHFYSGLRKHVHL
jgi:patatin-related protein